MRYSILGFNQKRVLQLQRDIVDGITGNTRTTKIDIVDLLILQDIADFMNRRNIIKYVIDEKTFFSVKYQVIIDDLPILNIKQQALSDRLKKLCDFGLLEKAVVKNQSGSYTAFRIGMTYEDIVYNNGCYVANMENRSHTYLDTSAKVAEYECNIYNNNIYNNNKNNSSTINSKEEDTNVSPKKNDYQLIVDCWNEYNGRKLGKVAKLTDKRKKAIKRALDDNGIDQEQLKNLFKTLPFADSWLYNPNKQHANWKPDFDWWMANTNGWLTKALEGKVHRENPHAFDIIMNGSNENIPYTPQGRSIWFDENTKAYWTDDNFYYGVISDGYSDEDRPDGATLTMSNARGIIKWNSSTKKWEKK